MSNSCILPGQIAAAGSGETDLRFDPPVTRVGFDLEDIFAGSDPAGIEVQDAGPRERLARDRGGLHAAERGRVSSPRAASPSWRRRSAAWLWRMVTLSLPFQARYRAQNWLWP